MSYLKVACMMLSGASAQASSSAQTFNATILTPVATTWSAHTPNITILALKPEIVSWINSYIYATGHTLITWPYFALCIGVFFLANEAYRQQQRLNEQARHREAQTLRLRAAWQSALKWQAFIGLVELWIFGRIIWGPWDADSFIERWEDKGPLKRLVRAGVLPLHIDGGGVKTYSRPEARSTDKDKETRKYVRSTSRAHFDFIMFYPFGYEKDPIPWRDQARENFLIHLKEQTRYAVNITFMSNGLYHDQPPIRTPTSPVEEPLEIGKESRSWLLLPFKRNVVLKEGTGDLELFLEDYVPQWWNSIEPTVRMSNLAIVRLEALDFDEHRLDEFVFRLARSAHLGDVWIEDELSRATGHLLSEHDVDFPSHKESSLKPLFRPSLFSGLN